MRIEHIDADVLVIPTDLAESDGTFAWTKTTMVIAHVHAAGKEGIGWTFASGAAADLITGPLANALVGSDPLARSEAWSKMNRALRNIGRPGLGWEALSAVDVALWDLAGKLVGLSVARMLGAGHFEIDAYGSGGFTSYDDETLAEQLGGWVDENGFRAVKMKVGRDPSEDEHRVAVARRAIGAEVDLLVDANGAWSRKQALACAHRFALCFGVTWLEEPVSSEDIAGLRLVRDRAPVGVEVTTGEYGYVLPDFRRFLLADCVDVLQADATRCGGVTGLIAVAALAETFNIPLSTHCAPLLHAQVACAIRPLRHIEWFYDHARIERLLFEDDDVKGRVIDGRVTVNPSKPGLGMSLRSDATNRFRILR